MTLIFINNSMKQDDYNTYPPKPKKPMVVLRLQKDLQSYSEEKISFVKLLFPDEQSIQIIDVQIVVE